VVAGADWEGLIVTVSEESIVTARLVDNDRGTVAAVRDGVNRRDRSKDHAEFIAL
jgi:hypothetical protein